MKHAKQQRREESAEPAERADQSGHGSGIARESFGHELEHGAIPESEQRRATERADGEGDHRRPRQQQREAGDTAEHPRQHLRAADAIGQPAAERPHHRREHDEARGAKSGVARGQSELRCAAASADRLRTRRSRRRSGSRRRRATTRPALHAARAASRRRRPGAPPSARCARATRRRQPRPTARRRRPGTPPSIRTGPRPPRRRTPRATGRTGRGRTCRAPFPGSRGGVHRDTNADADRKRRTGEPDEECRCQERRVARGQAYRPRRRRGHREQRREHHAAAKTIRQHAHRQSRERAEQHGYGDEKRRLRTGQMVEIREDGRKPADQSPRREGDRKR